MPVIEAVPNLSEGRRGEVVALLAAAFRSAPGVRILDLSSDPSHHRSVLTAIGEPAGLEEAALRLARAAVDHIDLRQHHGEHPRIGAVDVLPFVPIADATMEECRALARRVGERMASELEIPIYLYGEAAAQPERRNLARVRQGQFEALAARMKSGLWQPDYGPSHPHPTAGASAVGARDLLIAFNVNLSTDRIDVAKAIARTVRTSGGGLPEVKALGIRLRERGIVQVSMNLTDYRVTPIGAAFEAVRRQAERQGVSILGTEIVGLAPRDALIPSAARDWKLQDADQKVLEAKIAAG